LYNHASLYGGAIYNDGSVNGVSSPILNQVTFSYNSAGDAAGAMANDGALGTSSPASRMVDFDHNSASSGYGGPSSTAHIKGT